MAGLNARAGKLAATLIAAVLASIAGTLYATYFHYLSPDMVGSTVSLTLITMVIVGGAATAFGPIVGAALLTIFPTLNSGFSTYFSIAEGALLILCLRYLPSGLYGGFVQAVNAGTRLVVGSRPRVPRAALAGDGETKPDTVMVASAEGKQ
jgi:branched-chain amino acid transport system permease protein